MSSTNFRSILIFASCVVGTRNILDYMGDSLLGGLSAGWHFDMDFVIHTSKLSFVEIITPEEY